MINNNIFDVVLTNFHDFISGTKWIAPAFPTDDCMFEFFIRLSPWIKNLKKDGSTIIRMLTMLS